MKGDRWELRRVSDGVTIAEVNTAPGGSFHWSPPPECAPKGTLQWFCNDEPFGSPFSCMLVKS